MGLRRSVFTIGGYTFISRITGFLRDILIAAILGAGMLADTFFVAFKLPNFFRRLFGEGAFNAAFVPMFSAKLAKDGQEKARLFAENIFAVMFFFLLLFTLVIEIAMPLVMFVLAPGFVDNPEQYDLAVYLTRVTFPYLFFICLVALMSGVLNSLDKFAAGAAAPILLNICLIGFLLLLREYYETPAHALAWGVAFAGLLQFVWLFVACRRAGLPVSLKLPKLNPEVKKMVKLMIPGIIGAGVVQINLWVDIVIGTLIPKAISYLYYADRINQLPLGVIGIAVGTALLPMLSKQIGQGKKQEAVASMNKALGLALFLVIPSAVGSVVLAHPIISVLFERGAFGPEAALATSYGLIAYALGLPAFVMIKIFTPGFFAVHDTKTPVKIAALCVAINIVLNLTFVFGFKAAGYYPHVGIALATSFAAWVNVWLLARILHKDGRFKPDAQLKSRIMKTILSSLVMAAVVYGLLQLAGDFLRLAEVERLLTFTAIILIGAAAFFFTAIKTRTISTSDLRLLRRKKQ